MRRGWTLSIVAAVAIGTIGFAAPVHANELTDCDLGSPPPPTAIEGGSQIRIYPDRVDDDAVSVAGWIVDYVLCLEGGTVNELVACLQSRPSGPYVWYESETGAIVIDFQRIRNDWFAFPLC